MFYQLLMPRNPLMRLLAAVVGALALVAVLALGMFAFAALVLGAAVWWLVRSIWPAPRLSRSPAAGAAPRVSPDVIEGEFTVVKSPASDRGNPEHTSR